MTAIVIEHVKVSELPEKWRAKLSAAENARVTVRIEEESGAEGGIRTSEEGGMPAFGMWRDREEMADVEAHVRKLRQRRY